jgi:4-oxalocrotonate tautomerase
MVPYVEVKAFERRLEDEAKTKELIAAITDAFCEVYGEDVRSQTWVVVQGVPAERWGFGGKTVA